MTKRYVGPEVDVWSLGVILFTILAGYPPFKDNTFEQIKSRIVNDSKDLTQRMLTVDISKRATIAEILQHPWVIEGFGEPPETCIPERPIVTNEDVTDAYIEQVEWFGYDPEEVKKQLVKGEVGPGWALYWLFKERSEKDVDSRTSAKFSRNAQTKKLDQKQNKFTKSIATNQAPGTSEESNSVKTISKKCALRCETEFPVKSELLTCAMSTNEKEFSSPDTNYSLVCSPLTFSSGHQTPKSTCMKSPTTVENPTLPDKKIVEFHNRRTTTSVDVPTDHSDSLQQAALKLVDETLSSFERSNTRADSSKSSNQASSSGFSLSKLSVRQLPSSQSSTTAGEKSKASLFSTNMEMLESREVTNSRYERRRSLPHIVARAFQLMNSKKSRRPSEKPLLETDVNSKVIFSSKYYRRKSSSEIPKRKVSGGKALLKRNRSKSPDSLIPTDSNNPIIVGRSRRSSEQVGKVALPIVASMSVETTSVKSLEQIIKAIEKALKIQEGLSFTKFNSDDISTGPVAGMLHFFETRSRRNSVLGSPNSPNYSPSKKRGNPDPEVQWNCSTAETTFEIKLFKIPGTKMRGVIFHRIRGSTYNYQRHCNEIMEKWKI
ncbi:serine/threonine-protein kinase KIN2 [Nowakowskiella sp. JEL0078]|nr:serine/threonine-protein kinase KIN2 [Nowakowskiella sp. JEL0078]